MDSVALAMAVEKTCQTGILQPAVHGRYGAVIINSILYFPFHLFEQNADFVTRFSSVLFHALSIVAFYYFIRNLFRDRIQAIFGALLLSFTPLYFNPNTYGKEHGMGLFFLLLSFIALDAAMRKSSNLLTLFACAINVFSITVRESLIWTVPLFYLFAVNPSVLHGYNLPEGIRGLFGPYHHPVFLNHTARGDSDRRLPPARTTVPLLLPETI